MIFRKTYGDHHVRWNKPDSERHVNIRNIKKEQRWHRSGRVNITRQEEENEEERIKGTVLGDGHEQNTLYAHMNSFKNSNRKSK